MKRTTQLAILIASACLLVGCAIGLTVLAAVDFDFSRLSNSTPQTNTYTIDQKITAFDIRTAESDIVFLPSPDGTFSVTCEETDRVTHSVSVTGSTLTVRRQDSRKWYEHIGLFFYNAKITVYIPEAMPTADEGGEQELLNYQKLYLRTTSGNIMLEAERYGFIDAELHTSSGDITYHVPTSKSLTVTASSGNVDAGGYPMGVVQITTSSGNVTLPGMTGSYVSVTTSSGNITADRADMLGLDISASSGNIKLSQSELGALAAHTSSGNIKISDTTATGINLQTSSGDVRMNRADADTIGIRTSSGEVTCHLLTPKNYITRTGSGSISTPPTPTERLTGNCEIQTGSGDIRITVENQ